MIGQTVKLREWGWLDMTKHPAENVDIAFRRWIADRIGIIDRIDYVNPYLNEFGVPRLTRNTINTPYTGHVTTILAWP